MITREKRKLMGSARRVDCNFAVFEIIDGNPIETRHQSAGYSIYDLDGKLIEEVSPYRLMMDDSYKDIYIYDKQDKLIKRDEYDENELLRGKTTFDQIDSKNRIERHYYYDKQGLLKLGSHTIYDSEDELIETAHYDENENVSPQHIYKSNPSKKIRKNNLPDNDGYTIEEFRNNERGKFTDRTVTSYDAKGNLKEFSCYNSDGTLTLKDEYEYEFDSVRNWIKKIQYHWVIGWGEFSLIPLTISRRQIDYY
jgi:hypothetical protein